MIDAINSPKNPAMDEKAADTNQQQARANTPHQNIQQDAAHLQRLINDEHPTSRRTSHESSTVKDKPKSMDETQSQSKPREKKEEEVNKKDQKNRDEQKVDNQKKENPKKTSQKVHHDDMNEHKTNGQQTIDAHKNHHKKTSQKVHHDTSGQQPLMTNTHTTTLHHAPQSTTQATATTETPTISPALSQVAERILVSSQQARGGEVRIKVDSRLLPQTEIRLTQRGGGLMVQMNTASPVSHHVLATEQSNLADLLTRQSGFDVDVQLNYTSEQEQGNPDQRSRGLNLMGEDDETSSS